MTLQLRYAAHSEIGLVRKNNQDSGYASPRMLVVADGMGGAAAGDLASAAAVQLLRKADRGADGDQVSGEEMLELMAGALHQANEKIADLVADDHALEGMGTTVTGALFDGHQLGLVHIGDSRAYLQRDDELIRLTHDHSWVQSLVDEGKITPEEAAYHPHRSLILKVLNGQPMLDPDTSLVDVADGDRLLFCSDGLCGLVEDDEISEALLAHDDLDAVLDQLIAAAHREGGVDNITIILADVYEAGSRGDTGVEPDPRVVGAAVDREIPVVEPRPIDLGDSPGAPRRTDSAGNTIPAAPAPDSPDEEEEESIRYAPTLRPGRRRLWRGLIAGVLVLALLGAGLGAGYAWSRTQYYVGPSGEQVAIHRGLAQNVLGFPLSDVYEVQDIRIDDLPPFYRDRVIKTISLHSLDEARTTTGQLKTAADRCIAQRQARATPSPTPAPPTEQPPAAPPGPPGEPAPPATAPPTTAPPENPPANPPAPTTENPAPSASATPLATATPDPSEVC